MIEGAVILLVGLIIGRLSANVKRHAASSPLVLTGATVCGCTHHLSLHDPQKNDCHGLIKNPAYEKDHYINKSNPTEIKCTCRHFVATDDSAAIVAAFNPRSLEP